jgi:hypothetical protein
MKRNAGIIAFVALCTVIVWCGVQLYLAGRSSGQPSPIPTSPAANGSDR